MKIYEIYFSPTGGTKQVADVLAEGLHGEVAAVDLTGYQTKTEALLLSKEDVAVIAVPSYGGRVPEIAVKKLEKMKGNGAAAVLTCVYGNRAYEDTLVELEDTAERAGFHTIAAVAAVAEHSIVRKYAAGRPDSEDRKELINFAAKIREKILEGNMETPSIPGNRPYKKAGGAGMVPKPDKTCVNCGICAKQCPVHAIDKKDPKKVEKGKCISCMRCITVCPHLARKVNPLMLTAADLMLKKVCSERKENELFLF